MPKIFFEKRKIPSPFWVLCAFLILVFLTGGSSAHEVQSLIILRPAAALVCVYGLWGLRREHIRQYRFLFGFATALFGLVGLHLMPLPPMIWGALPGRELISEIDRVAGFGGLWRPISIVPWATWNALFSLLVPLAVLLLGVQITREQRFQLLPVILCLGLVSGLLGLLQVIGPADGPLYFYKVTNTGAAVGLYANRNHQAVLLASMFTLLAVYACTGIKSVEQARIRLWVAVAAGVVLIPLVLVTGSRAGLITGAIALLILPMLYHKPEIAVPKKRKFPKKHIRLLIFGFAIIGIGLLTILFARAQAFDRLMAPDQTGDERVTLWAQSAQMAWKYFPIGSGIGSFVEAYQIDESFESLTDTYANHAHNDWLEVYVTGGLIGLVMLGIAVIAWMRIAFAIWKSPRRHTRDDIFVRLGSIIFLIMAIASIGDYPLRVPSIACFMAVAALWLQGGDKRANAKLESKSDGNLADTPLANLQS